jgi:hypothetical protein
MNYQNFNGGNTVNVQAPQTILTLIALGSIASAAIADPNNPLIWEWHGSDGDPGFVSSYPTGDPSCYWDASNEVLRVAYGVRSGIPQQGDLETTYGLNLSAIDPSYMWTDFEVVFEFDVTIRGYNIALEFGDGLTPVLNTLSDDSLIRNRLYNGPAGTFNYIEVFAAPNGRTIDQIFASDHPQQGVRYRTTLKRSGLAAGGDPILEIIVDRWDAGLSTWVRVDSIGPMNEPLLDAPFSCVRFGQITYGGYGEFWVDHIRVTGTPFVDCNGNGVDDALDLADCDGSAWCSDCNGNGNLDECDINPSDPNSEMAISEDCNGNGVPDECEPDTDGDGWIDVCDNCPQIPNVCQNDLDQDGVGDACDNDIDGDGIMNDEDVCDYTPYIDPDPNEPNSPNAAPVIRDPNSSLYGTLRGDYNGDCDCDAEDFQAFQLDMTGPGEERSDKKPAGLIAYWDFEEGSGTTVFDQSGNGHDGTPHDGFMWSNNASPFPGSQYAGQFGTIGVPDAGYVLVPDADALDPTEDFTFSAWINTFDGAHYNGILGKHVSGITQAGNWTWGTSWNAPNSAVTHYCIGTPWEYELIGTTGGPRNQWLHFTMTYHDATDTYEYWVHSVVNDQIQLESYETGTYVLDIMNNSIDLGIGRMQPGAGIFKGFLDEVCMFNRVISEAEIRTLVLPSAQ